MTIGSGTREQHLFSCQTALRTETASQQGGGHALEVDSLHRNQLLIPLSGDTVCFLTQSQ
jgi:hypothetical protein